MVCKILSVNKLCTQKYFKIVFQSQKNNKIAAKTVFQQIFITFLAGNKSIESVI